MLSKKKVAALAAATSFLSFPGVGNAQLEEIVVTAEKRAENVQDVPIAITAFGEDSLENSGFDNISDLTFLSPSLQFGNFGPVTFVTLRGIGNENTTAGGDPGVALHYDGIYMGRPVASLFSSFDSERVEILRGPQGTLYGRNATGGSLNYITKKPGDEYEGEVDLTVGDYNWVRARGAINIPLSESVNSRFVAFIEDRDGYTENSVPGGTEANDAENFGIRSHIAFDIGDSASLLLSGTFIDVGGVGSKAELREPFPGSTIGQPFAGPPIPGTNDFLVGGTVLINDLTPFREAKDLRESVDNDFLLLSATYEREFEGFTFKSITGYAETSFESHQDEDYSSKDLAELVLTEDAEQFSQEFQLLSNGEGPLQWIAGLYYFDEDAERQSRFFRSRYDIIAGQFGVESGFNVGGVVNSTSIALFGQTTYQVNDTLGLTAGIRYTDDEKDGANRGFQFGAGGGPYDDPVGDSWDEVTYRLALDWRLSDASLLFGSFSTGYKSGGINQVAAPSLGRDAIYNPESVDALEVGIKTTLLEGRLQLNAAFYHNEYEDLQFQVFQNNGPAAFNASGATVQGFELEARALVGESLGLDASLGVTDSEFDTQVVSGVQLGGNQVQRTPDLTYSLGLTNDWSLESNGSLRLRLEYSFTDDIFYTAFNRAAPTTGPAGSDLAEDYTNANARLFWFSPTETWTAELSVTNIADDAQVGNILRGIGFLDTPGGGGPEDVTYNPPRQVGLRVAYQF